VQKISDTGKIAAAFHQKAAEYDHHVLVQKRVVSQLTESVGLHLKQLPRHILDVGTGTGALLERLHGCYHDAGLTGIDIALNMCLRSQQKMGSICRIVNGSVESLPFRAGSFDLVVSASMLQWVGDLSAALHEMCRVTQPGGTISVAFFCQGTLAEMQSCFHDAVGKLCNDNIQRTSRLHAFHTVDEVKSIVDSMNLDRAVISVETEIDWYDDLYSLLRSIKNIGAGPVSGATGSGLGWRGVLQEASRLYQERHGVEGEIPATYKVLYLNATVG
jgi:malonyl-CoA O-methyltransferase